MESPFIFKGKDYLYFPDGCKFYSLYRTTRKINSFSELEYIGEKFFYLNPSFDIEVAKKLFIRLSERDSGHIIRTYGDSRVENMIERVSERKKVPYCGRLRKIIFNPSKMIGSIIGTKERPTSTQIDEVVEELWLDQQKITYTKIANKLNTSRYLISWYFNEEVTSSIKNANEEIRQTNLISKAVEAIDILTDKGNKLKMRELKKLTSIRNYSLLKKAVTVYLNGL